jgi:hypothetical protein
MAFELQEPRIAVSIGDLGIKLRSRYGDLDEDPEELTHSAEYEFAIVFDDGSQVIKRGNLIPHITIPQRDALLAFMDALRAQAIAQVLG